MYCLFTTLYRYIDVLRHTRRRNSPSDWRGPGLGSQQTVRLYARYCLWNPAAGLALHAMENFFLSQLACRISLWCLHWTTWDLDWRGAPPTSVRVSVHSTLTNLYCSTHWLIIYASEIEFYYNILLLTDWAKLSENFKEKFGILSPKLTKISCDII